MCSNVCNKFVKRLKEKLSFINSSIKRVNFPTFKISLDISVLIVLLSFVLVSSIFLPEVIFDLLSYAQPISISEYFCEPVILAGGVIEPGANPLYKVGDKKTFYARRFTTGVEGEEYALSAACRAVGQFCYVFVEEGQKVDDFWINNLKAEFDEKISHKEKIRNRFELTFENEGRVVLLLLDVKDEWKPQKREERYIAGYFWAENQLPGFRSQTGNEMELLYLDINPANLTTADFLETVSHEYEHLINWSFAEIRIWLIIFFQTGFISFFVLNYFLGRKWKGKL